MLVVDELDTGRVALRRGVVSAERRLHVPLADKAGAVLGIERDRCTDDGRMANASNKAITGMMMRFI